MVEPTIVPIHITCFGVIRVVYQLHAPFSVRRVSFAYMKSTDVIKRDHEAAKELFDKYKAGSSEERGALEPDIFKALATHEKMEDDYFYPALDGKLDLSEFQEAEEEQQTLEEQVTEIQAMEADAREQALLDAMDKVLAHAEREESFFPDAEAALGEEASEALGEQMEPNSAVANS